MGFSAHVVFDTLKFVETLVVAGMPERQAKALAHAQKEVLDEMFDNTVATKSDIFASEARLKAEIADVRTELKAEIAEVKSDIRLSKWISGATLTGMGVLISGAGALVLKVFF